MLGFGLDANNSEVVRAVRTRLKSPVASSRKWCNYSASLSWGSWELARSREESDTFAKTFITGNCSGGSTNCVNSHSQSLRRPIRHFRTRQCACMPPMSKFPAIREGGGGGYAGVSLSEISSMSPPPNGGGGGGGSTEPHSVRGITKMKVPAREVEATALFLVARRPGGGNRGVACNGAGFGGTGSSV